MSTAFGSGTEYACSGGDAGQDEASLECRAIIDRATSALAVDVPNPITKVVLAALPDTYVTADGKELTPRMAAGVMTRKAVVIDRLDGSRQAVGLWCYLPYEGQSGRLQVSMVRCDVVPLEDWRDGTVPHSSTPGGLSG